MSQLEFIWSPRPAGLSTSTRYTRRECQKCQKLFTTRTAYLKRGKGRFCSGSCASSYNNRLRRGTDWNYNSARSGPDNPCWKGGVSKDHMRYRRRFAAKSPEKVRAHRLVMNAIRSGRLQRRPCEKCGGDFRIAAHHDDYTRPLEVRWLCQPCHNRHHAWLKAQRRDPDTRAAV